MYLVDTNVISAAAPTKRPNPKVVDWLRQNTGILYVSAVTVTEIEDGIAQVRRRQATEKASALTIWLEGLLHLYAARIIVFDIPIARRAGRLSDVARAHGHAPGFADIAIAATAQHRGLIVLSRNLRHFVPLGVTAVDPFAELPDA